MRVITGSAKGRKLKAVPGNSTRPITDRVKEALFDILGTNVRQARLLDLFGGTGSVGIEALSRGAREAVFVEKARPALDTIRHNLEATRLSGRARVIRGDAFDYLKGPPAPFEYVYVAPPQHKELWLAALKALDLQPGWLASDGEIIVQIHPAEFRPVELRHFEPIDERKYGSTMLIFYARRER